MGSSRCTIINDECECSYRKTGKVLGDLPCNSCKYLKEGDKMILYKRTKIKLPDYMYWKDSFQNDLINGIKVHDVNLCKKLFGLDWQRCYYKYFC